MKHRVRFIDKSCARTRCDRACHRSSQLIDHITVAIICHYTGSRNAIERDSGTSTQAINPESQLTLLIHLSAVKLMRHPCHHPSNQSGKQALFIIGNLDMLTMQSQYGIAQYIQIASASTTPMDMAQYVTYVSDTSKDVMNALHFDYDESSMLLSRNGGSMAATCDLHIQTREQSLNIILTEEEMNF
uniref:Uncharacterized protein n=1 Tax=Ditylenchus dipsaci TaxID=166011 RepID=A0A915DMT4_9BILA